MERQRRPLERALDAALHVPLGVVESLRGAVPASVAQRRQAIENRVLLARFIGELVVKQGRREVASVLEAKRAEQAAAAAAPSGAHDEPAAEPAAPAAAAPHGAHEPAPLMTADELPIGGYESLAAIHVVERLATLRADELEAIRQFEESHRARRTILAKIAQLQGD